MAKTFNTVDEGIDAVYKLGFKDIHYLSFGANCVRKRGCSHTMVCIEDLHGEGTITFAGQSFEDWKLTI